MQMGGKLGPLQGQASWNDGIDCPEKRGPSRWLMSLSLLVPLRCGGCPLRCQPVGTPSSAHLGQPPGEPGAASTAQAFIPSPWGGEQEAEKASRALRPFSRDCHTLPLCLQMRKLRTPAGPGTCPAAASPTHQDMPQKQWQTLLATRSLLGSLSGPCGLSSLRSQPHPGRLGFLPHPGLASRPPQSGCPRGHSPAHV